MGMSRPTLLEGFGGKSASDLRGRYHRDPIFHALVTTMAKMLNSPEFGELTIGDMAEAFVVLSSMELSGRPR